MPNHVQNRITFEGDPERIRHMLEQIQSDAFGLGSVDFNKIIPMPDTVYCGNLGPRERQLYGKNNWYDWSVEHWGTKWNAYGYDEDMVYTLDEPLLFLTAWTAPHPILEKLAAMFSEITITHEWADEDIGMNCGRRMYQSGERTEEYMPDFKEESVSFAASVWGFSPEDLDFFDEDESPHISEI